MKTAKDLREIPTLPDEIIQAALDGDLVLFVGAGISMLMGLPSWSGFAWKILQQLQEKGLLNHSEIDQLESLKDPRKQLSIAVNIAEIAGVNPNLAEPFKRTQSACEIYQHINAIGCSYVTTNYDDYLETSKTERHCEPKDFLVSRLDTPGSVVHLHGFLEKPETMIVTTLDYLQHYDDEFVQNFLGHLFSKKTVLFVGYGLEEAEILEHILRRGNVRPNAEKRRFMLQGFFATQRPLYENLSSYYESSFGVDLIGFLRDHENFSQQTEILENWRRKIRVKTPRSTNDLDFISEVLDDE